MQRIIKSQKRTITMHNSTDAVKPEDPGVAPSLYHGVSTMQLFGSTYGLQARCLFMHKCFVSWDTLALVS